jgi:hypothetical protein
MPVIDVKLVCNVPSYINLGSPMYIVRLEAVFLHSALKQTP